MKQRHNKEVCKEFGIQVRKLRIAKGFKKRKFAAGIDMDYSQLAKIERGAANPTITTVFAIAEGLGLPASELLDIKLPKLKK